MNRQNMRRISLFLVVLLTAMASAKAQITVKLAEPSTVATASAPPVTTTTTTTTTTLPTIPRCPNGLTGASETGSLNGTNYWAFNYDTSLCRPSSPFDQGAAYCFENPWVDVSRSDRVDWELTAAESTKDLSGSTFLLKWLWVGSLEVPNAWGDYTLLDYLPEIVNSGANQQETCYICSCVRIGGCFPPGVKITMADGSLRNIEDVRAGDAVRNAKTGAPVKVGRVIEGPEALPLLRFGFDGTTVTTSQAHPVLTAMGLRPANQLKKGDIVFDALGNPHPLTILEALPIEEGQRVINVDLDAASSDTNDRLLVSDGIITGDLVLQGLLKEHK